MKTIIRRRTCVVGAFPDGQSCLNLAAARLRYIAWTAWSAKCPRSTFADSGVVGTRCCARSAICTVADYDQNPVTAICSGRGVNLVINRLLCQSSTSCKSTHCSATRIASSSSVQLMIVRRSDNTCSSSKST